MKKITRFRGKKTKSIPRATLNRLPLYLRALSQVEGAENVYVSSRKLAELVGSNSAQVRKDLSCLGELGVRGMGYDVQHLERRILTVLGLLEPRKAVVVGVGRLGSALIGYPGFVEKGFEIIAAFDADPKKVGEKVADLKIRSIKELKRYLIENGPVDIGIVAVPSSSAQEVAELLVEAGVKSILNFAPVSLEISDNIPVRYVDLAVEMQILSYYLIEKSKKKRPIKNNKEKNLQ